MKTIISNRRLYLDSAKQRVLEDGDPDAAYLLVGEGCEIAVSEAERYGLKLKNGDLVVPRQKTPTPVAPDLPDDIPGRDKLVAYGVLSLNAVRALAKYTEVPGVGRALGKKIAAYLDDLESGE